MGLILLIAGATFLLDKIRLNPPSMYSPVAIQIPPSATIVVYPTPPAWVNQKILGFIESEANNPTYRTYVPIPLIYKLIEWESGWHQYIFNNNFDSKGRLLSIDQGMMMLNSLCVAGFIHDYKDPWRKESSYDTVHNVYDNLQIGIRRLRYLYEVLGTWKKVIAAYNAGITTVERRWTLKKSTQKEVDFVVPVENWWDIPEGVIVFYKK
jgi:Transglycosylase SLT domain